MSLGRLLGLSGALSGRLRRSLSTAASPKSDGGWSWYMLSKTVMAVGPASNPTLQLAHPPRVSSLYMPENLVGNSGSRPDPDSNIMQCLLGEVCSANRDGLLLLVFHDIRATAPILAKQGANQVRQSPVPDLGHLPGIKHFVYNPTTGQLFRLPEIEGPRKILFGSHMGLLTQTRADRGRGPPDRFAVAELHPRVMRRFLSETGEWEIVECSPRQLPRVERLWHENQEVLAFSGQLWWVDLTWGALTVDPFSDRPEPRFVELPSGSVLPAGTQEEAFRRGSPLPDAKGNVWWMRAPAMYRRMGISEGWLRFVEVSQEEPFLLSSFAVNEDGSGWTLEHRVELSRLWVDGDHPWLPLQGETTPQIGSLDPFDANVVHLTVGRHAVMVDMEQGKVIRHCPHGGDIRAIPCVLSPWLPTTRIPSAGTNKDGTPGDTAANVEVL